MKKLIIACLALFLFVGTGYAELLGTWEGATDGWTDRGSGLSIDDGTLMPSMYDYAAVGATEGSQSIRLVTPISSQTNTLQLQMTPAQKTAFMENDTLSIDLSVAADTLGVGGYAKIANVIINAEGSGWSGQGVSLTLNFYDGSPEQTETLSFDYSATRDAIVAALGEGVMPSYIQLIIATNGTRATTPDATAAEMYFDNVTMTGATPPPSPELLGTWESNWEGNSNDGWSDTVTGYMVDDVNVMPSIYDFATVCVTDGSQSLKLTTLGQSSTLKLALSPDQRAAFMENDIFSADFGIAADTLGVGGFATIVKIKINSAEITETSVELPLPLQLGFSAGSPEKVETFEVDYSAVRDAIAAALSPDTVPGWINIIIVTNGRRGDAEPYSPAEMYFDNVRLSTARDPRLLGAWESAADGWIDNPTELSVDDATLMPSKYNYATECATEGSQSLKLIAPMAQENTLELKLTPEQRMTFLENNTLSIDFGIAADILGVTGYAKITNVIINAEGIDWTPQDVSLQLGFLAGSPEKVETLSFDYSAARDAIVDAIGEGVTPTHVNIVISTNGVRNTTPEASPAEMYFDNVRLSTPELLGSWEGNNDGWNDYPAPQYPVDDPNVMPSKYDYATVCVTEGSQSLKLIVPMTQQNTLQLKLTPDQRTVFMENGTFSIDVGIAADELGVGGFAKIANVIINAEGINWTPQGVSLQLGFEADSPEKVETLSFDYTVARDAIAAAIGEGVMPEFVHIIIATTGVRDTATPSAAEMYFDNVILSSAPLPTITVDCIEDTYTAKNTPDVNDGERETVQVKSLDAGWAREAYLKFDASAVPGNIHNAELTLNVWGGARDAVVSTDTIYPVSGPWSESTLTWDMAARDLVWGEAVGSLTSTFVANSFYTFDLSTVAVESDRMISLGVRTDFNPAGNQGNWKSSENTVAANRPQLTIYYDPEQAVEVTPIDEETGVHPLTSLIWQEAADATAHEVYFGTTSGDLVLQTTVLESANISSDPNLFEWIPTAALDLTEEYFWRIDEVIGGKTIEGEEWSFTVADSDLDIPVLVSPADGDTVVEPLDLVWIEGYSADSHDLYLGTDDTLVAALDGSVKIAGATSPLEVEGLDLETEYFWTVQATAASGGPWSSVDVFSFTTDDYATLDNFDDGMFWIETPGTGADVNDLVITLGSASVMEFTYDDAGDVVSEASLTFDAAKDLSAATGRKALAMRVYGQAGNAQEEMYVALSDGGTPQQVAVLFNGDYEPVDLTLPLYAQGSFVEIDLAKFDSVDLSAVTSIAIGFGDGVSEGKSGTVYIDSIIVHASRCVGMFVDGDIVDGDCIADVNDLAILVADWLEAETTVDETTASTDGLIVHFEFEEAVDSNSVTSSVTYDGVNYAIADVVGVPILGVAGHTGNAIDMATAGHVSIPSEPQEVFASLTDEITVSLWCYGNITDLDGAEVYKSRVFRAYTSVNTLALDAVMPDERGRIIFGSQHMGGSWMAWNDATPADWTGAWNHYAFVIDAASNFQAIYCNGVMVALENDDVSGYAFDLAGLDRFDIGMTPAYHGKIDDFRIYNRALDAGEIVDLAGLASVVQPIESNADVNDDGKVNLIDFAEVSTIWLEKVMWP